MEPNASYNKTGMPTIQHKKKKTEEIVGKYFNMESHKLKSPSIKSNNDEHHKKLGQLDALPINVYPKSVSLLEEPKPPMKKSKLIRIDENLLSTAAKQLPQILDQNMKSDWD